MKQNSSSLGETNLFKKKTTPSLKQGDCALWLEKIAQGDREAYQQLYQRFFHPVQKIIFGYVGQRELAEDLSQDFFTALWKKKFSFQPREFVSGEAFLFRWVRNHSIDYLRKKELKPTSLATDKSYSPPDPLLSDELSQVVRESLAKLAQNQYLVLVLREMEGLSLLEISQIMDTTERSVEGLIYRAKKKLVELLKNYL